MAISAIYESLRQIAVTEFGDIVVTAEIQRLPTGDPRKLRLGVVDKSFIDIFISITGRYSYHWDRTMTSNADLYRHDNAPHKACHIKHGSMYQPIPNTSTMAARITLPLATSAINRQRQFVSSARLYVKNYQTKQEASRTDYKIYSSGLNQRVVPSPSAAQPSICPSSERI